MSAELGLRLSHRPGHLLDSVITISDPPEPMDANFQDRLSSTGTLNRLPIELVYEVLGSLDFQSITRFARVSIRGKNIVQSFPAYRHLMNHAPDALAALGQTRLLSLYSASHLLATLRSERCATCPEYGAYLFLLTCERCCWECLKSQPLRRVLTPSGAGRVFALTPKMVKQLPVQFSIPGIYKISREVKQRSFRLCSIPAAKKLAMSVHGSAESLTRVVTRKGPKRSTEYLQAVLSACTYVDQLTIPIRGYLGADRYFGMSFIPFPSLTAPDMIEHGLWCKGCEWTFDQYSRGRLPSRVIADMVPGKLDPDRILLGMARRARSRMGHVAHVQHCYGAQRLLAVRRLE
ncbi:F-box domain-containing protein [Nemania sp. NC0429]|nr:F-box domain-containing protein [Nemania sp. NC0429]